MEVPQDRPGKRQEEQRRLAEDLGRLFEIGFNTGFLTAIAQHQEITTHFGDIYRDDLSYLRFSALTDEMFQRTGLISQWDQQTLEHWILYFFQKSFLSGLSLFDEYLQGFATIKPRLTRHIVYLQCNFYGKNSLNTYKKNDQTAVQDLMKQLQVQGYLDSLTEEESRTHLGKGNFLNADTLMLLKYGRQWRILCIDLSVFSVGSLSDTRDLTSIENIRRMLSTELRYLRSKSVFTNLSIDTEADTTSEAIVSSQLKHYFTAFKREDKETIKLIQAASYAYDFYHFLKKKHVLKEQDEVLFNIIGYTDRAINAMSVNQKQIHLLATCAEIYKTQTTHETIAQARERVLRNIQKAATKSFDHGREFMKTLVHLVDDTDGIQWLQHDETLEGFVNTRTPMNVSQLSSAILDRLTPEAYEDKHILDIHAALIHKELATRTPYLFLTGNPGIGKTTAIVNFLKAAERNGEGFFFLYVSPRKQVNLDIIQKFREDTGLPPCEQVFALTANSAIIRNNQARKTVHYYSEQRHDTFIEHGVTFIHAESDEAKRQQVRSRHLEEIQEGLLIDKGEHMSGVLNSLCRALYVTLDKPLANAIVATVAIQSLKRLGGNKGNTLHHFNTIFQGVYDAQGNVIPHKMELLRRNIKHLFIMIDEVTGDESGVEFLHGLHTFLAQRELLNSPSINTKIIVADASIVDPKVITRHLADTAYEPNKIYFRRVPSASQEQPLPLSIEMFPFRNEQATVINANAYPASKLHISYKIGVDALQYDEETYTERSKQLSTQLQQRIIKDITDLLQRDDVPQLLVYIQDKQRLALLIQAIKKIRGTFEAGEDYLEIHANISEAERESIAAYRKKTKVVFMTASASRGLSFPEATHILIDIPHFEVEQNLMEILQVIYRGRGGERDQEEKKLIFYLTDRAVYTDSSDRILSVRESMLHLLNVLIILKASIMTRIAGGLNIGVDQHFMVIPIGGKSVYAAGETFTARMSKLIKEAQTLSQKTFADKRLNYVYESLTQMLEYVRISLRPIGTAQKLEGIDRIKQHYIPLVPSFSHDFANRIRKGFDHLLEYPPLQRSHIAGSMLMVPIVNMSMQEAYWIQVEQVLERDTSKEFDLLTVMQELSHDRRYPESFHHALKDGIALIQALQDMAEKKLPHYEQESSYTDQYYAFPLVTFLAHETMSQYFNSKRKIQEDSEEMSFRALLEMYIRTLYPSDSMLPIGRSYDEFPFIVFRSLNLSEARSKMFTGKYLFLSQEFNIINMLLSSDE